MYLHSQCLYIIGAIRPPREVRKVELDLIPALIKSHRHRANEGFYSSCALVVRGPKASSHVLIVQDLDFKGKVLFEVFDDHYEEGKLDTQGLVRVGGRRYECS